MRMSTTSRNTYFPSRVRRSHGCDECRQRKVKCDETVPSCSRCLKSGRPCSGPVQGTIFLPYKKSRMLSKGEQSTPPASSGSTNLVSSQAVDNDEVVELANPNCPPSDSAQNLALAATAPRLVELSQSQVSHDVFVLRFVEQANAPSMRHNSLLADLPVISCSHTLPTLRTAIFAATVAMAGAATRNQGLISASQKACNAVIKTLSLFVCNTEMVNDTSELVSVTSSFGIVAHALGATQLMSLRSPSDFATGLAHKTFRALRLMSTCICICSLEPSPLAARQWISGPFVNRKSAYDQIIDIVVKLPLLLSHATIVMQSGIAPPIHPITSTILHNVSCLENSLLSWWLDLERDGDCARRHRWLWVETAGPYTVKNGRYHPTERKYRNDTIVECLSWYELSKFLLVLIRGFLGEPLLIEQCCARALRHSSSFFSLAPHIDNALRNGDIRPALQIMVPALLFSLLSPSQVQREYGRTRLIYWAEARPQKGWFAYATIYQLPPMYGEFLKMWDKCKTKID